MNLQLPDGTVVEDIPEGVTQSQVMERLKAAGFGPERFRAPDEQAAAESQSKASIDEWRKGMLERQSPGKTLMQNIGAGVENTWQGAKQLAAKVGLGGGVSDEEVRQKRADDETLAGALDMGGPDYLPTAGKVAQFGGEMLPSLAIPAGGMATGARAGARLLPKAWNAIQGAAPAAATAARAAPSVARMGTGMSMADMALGGAAGGALMPTTSDESKLLNTGIGAVGGAVIPAAAGGAKFLKRTLGSRERAASKLMENLGDEAATVAGQLEAPRTGRFTQDVPLTSAETTLNPQLARMERTAAAGDNPNWMIYRELQNEARGSALGDATASAERNAALAKARDDATGPLREEALESAGRWSHVAEPLKAQVDDLVTKSAPRSPQRNLANLVQDSINENASPAQLYELRKMLANKLSGPHVPGDDVAAIVKGANRETVEMIKAIDARLNEASDGKWAKYMTEYQRMSPEVTESRAMQQIRGDFTREGSERFANGQPRITAHKLGKAMEKYTNNAYGTRMTQQGQEGLDEVLANLRRSNIQADLKGAGTSGGGSNTLMDAAALAGGPKLTAAKQAINFIQKFGNEGEQQALNRALQNPAEAASLIRARLAEGQPLTKFEQTLLVALRGTTGPAAAQTMAPSR